MKVSSDRLFHLISCDLDNNTSIRPSTWRSFAAEVLRDTVKKKYLGSESNKTSADKAALDLFLKVNSELGDGVKEPTALYDQFLLGELKRSLDRFWFVEGDKPLIGSLHDIFMSGRCGPGSSIGLKETDFYSKIFSSKLTATSHALYLSYKQSVSCFPDWSVANEAREQTFGDVRIVNESKLSFVPKRNDISRTICTEPSLNMFYQLGLGRILERRLYEVYRIDLSTQPDQNRELSRQGSIDGSFSTIDLSSASDSLSTGVLREILPRGMFSWLHSLRSPSTKLPDGRVVALKMISSMGNGFTFPLETIIFCAVVDACYRLSGISLDKRGLKNFGVFGDDIICLTSVTQKVFRLLDLLGFKVNASKTFVEGPFRESCGYDWFNGHFVRGVYIKSLETPQDRYVAINMLNNWSAQTGIYLPLSIQYLVGTVRRVLIPPTFGYDQGIHVPLTMAQPLRNNNGSFKFPVYYPKIRKIRISDTGAFSGAWKDKILNFEGLKISFLAGYVRSHAIGLRQNDLKYGVKLVTSPYWDWIPNARLTRRFSFRQWETAVALNTYDT